MSLKLCKVSPLTNMVKKIKKVDLYYLISELTIAFSLKVNELNLCYNNDCVSEIINSLRNREKQF